MALGTLAFVTGAIHLDGFLDGCDAFFASVSAERRREILKDPRHGTFAVVAFVVTAALAGAALAGLPPPTYSADLAFLCAAARATSVVGAFAFPGAIAPAAGSHFARSIATDIVIGASIVGIAVAGFTIAPAIAVLVPVGLVLALACEFWICRRIGGLVGDAYGWTIVVLETLGIVALAAIRTHAR